ncbi:hypothetical protein [Micromonospora tarensis]|nr:hypothetical protein [Micromonospora tarensis]
MSRFVAALLDLAVDLDDEAPAAISPAILFGTDGRIGRHPT